VAAGIDLDQLPVESVSWKDAVEFCRVFTEQERKAGRLPLGWEYRLPTEAQWEYACRAGTLTRYSFGDDESRVGEFAWYMDNCHRPGTHEVGQKLPNPWGLHDIHGNVCEWCSDWYQDRLTGGTDPEGNEQASLRAHRGASWLYTGSACRSARRGGGRPDDRSSDWGFRVALVQPR
jgi:formylglycine-generating enzyme required for sulfatase activity